MAVASLIIGILGLLGSLMPIVNFIGVPVGALALVLGILARKRAQREAAPTGMATAGMVLGIIAIVLGVLLFAACLACVQAGREAQQQMADDPQVKRSLDDFQRGMREHYGEQTPAGTPSSPPSPRTAPGALPPPSGPVPSRALPQAPPTPRASPTPPAPPSPGSR